MLRVYNDLTRSKEVFEPLHPPRVAFYNCGPTVYGYFHIGNARNFVVVDMIRRYLTFRGFQVRFVQNITDIDDKIIRRAQEEGIPTTEVVAKYTEAYQRHLAAMGVDEPDVSPRATEHIPDMIQFIEKLIDRGYAYESQGDVYFRVSKFKDYGKLSGKKIEDLREGERVEVNPKKEDPKDFDLWKAAKPGEPTWDSPWGPGRPGWHIECSVMATTHLGETIDIHAGGSDLTFPHHENEIAQAEAATGKPFARYWIHNAFLNIRGEKMSKSLGNVVTMDQVLEKYDPMVVRYFFLSAHYRRPMDYSADSLDDARKALDRLVGGIDTIEKLLRLIARQGGTEPKDLPLEDRGALVAIREKFSEYMDDDFNTPRALSVLFDAVRDLHERRRKFEDPKVGPTLRSYAREAVATILELGAVLGLDLSPERAAPGRRPVEPLLDLLSQFRRELLGEGEEELAGMLAKSMDAAGYEHNRESEEQDWVPMAEAPSDAFEKLVQVAIDLRNRARSRKLYELADRIRSALGNIGIALEDYRSGTIWKLETPSE